MCILRFFTRCIIGYCCVPLGSVIGSMSAPLFSFLQELTFQIERSKARYICLYIMIISIIANSNPRLLQSFLQTLIPDSFLRSTVSPDSMIFPLPVSRIISLLSSSPLSPFSFCNATNNSYPHAMQETKFVDPFQ